LDITSSSSGHIISSTSDALRFIQMCNNLGWDSDSGTFLTEILFVCNLVSWAFWRLYQVGRAVRKSR
jgi:hypothetical protein